MATIVGTENLMALQPTHEVEVIKKPIKGNAPTVWQVTKTFKGQKQLRVEPTQKSLATAVNGGWLTAQELGKRLELDLIPQNSAVYDLKKVRLVRKAKIQFHNPSTGLWEDHTIANTSHQYLTASRQNDGNLQAPDSSVVVKNAKCARFSSPCPLILTSKMEMNGLDRLEKDCFANWFRKIMMTTDKDKQNMEMREFEHDSYDEDAHAWGTFQTAPDRDRTGLEKTFAELHAEGGKLNKQFKNIIKMEEELIDSKGMRYFEVSIGNIWFEMPDWRPGWQNFKLTVFLSSDELLLVAREAALDAKGTPLTKVRTVYNINQTYLKLPWHEVDNDLEMARFTRDNEIIVAAEKTQLVISETFPAKVNEVDGKELRHFTNPYDGFPKRGFCFCHPAK